LESKLEATAAQAKMLLNIRTSNQLDERGSEAPIHQGTLFKLLGFASVSSIDFYPAESPSHVMDLNRPLPSDLYGRFNLVYDVGTSEHCFCTSEVLSNAVRLTKLGGRVIHHVPLNNWVDHGSYQFSPTLLFDFYEANGFDELNMLLHFIDRRREQYLPYEPRYFGRLPHSFGGKTKVQGLFTARKAKLLKDIAFPLKVNIGVHSAAKRKTDIRRRRDGRVLLALSGSGPFGCVRNRYENRFCENAAHSPKVGE
jgi:hypothetical protein